MKKLKLLSLLFLVLLQGYGQRRGPAMTSELWAKDIEYLNKKIQKEFESFIPGIKDNFDKEVATLKKHLPTLENYEVACEIQRILSTLQDGHTELNIGHQTVGFHRVPLSLYFFEDELYVLAAHKEFEELVGSKVVGIGDLTIDQAYSLLKKNMSRDNDMEYVHAAPGYIILTELLACLGISPSSEEATFHIELPDGKTKSKIFKGLDPETYQQGEWATIYDLNKIEAPMYLSQRRSSYWFKYLPQQKTMYFNFTRVNNQKGKPSIKKVIGQLFDEIDELKPEKLVIDFRLNNGGNYHLSQPLINAIKARSWLNQKGKVWAITGRRTFSAASTACIFLKQETQTLLIGEVGRTHPNWADNYEYMALPNSRFLIEYTTKIKVHWPEEPNLDHIPVDIEIPPTFSGYSAGRDLVMEYILNN